MNKLNPGCCSSVTPCSHQKNNPTTLCAECQRGQEDTFVLPPRQRLDAQRADERVKLWKEEGANIGGIINVPKPKPTVLGTQVGGSHYTDCKIQPIEYIWANKLGFSEGNIVKYVTRWKAKGGVKDLKKAHHHLALLIEQVEANGL